MEFKKGQIVAILGCSQATEDKWIGPINKTCNKYSINTVLRLSAFIAQIGHESGHLRLVEENLNYSSNGLMNTFGKYFNAQTSKEYERKPEKIANRVYASRMGNGAETSGDGWKYRGRGLIQCTGKSNYGDCARAIGVDCLSNPDLLKAPEHAAMSAGWFWNSKGLNDYADRKEFLTITKRINGGTNGQADRQKIYEKAIIVLSGETDPSKVAPDTTEPIESKKTPVPKNSAIKEQAPKNDSEYPYNAVYESRSGHITQVDDTPGKEKLSTMHRTGSYWAIDPLGVFTHKSVLHSYKITKADSYEYTGGNYTNQVDGQFYTNSAKDMIFKSGGNVFVNTNRMQVNSPMLSASGEIYGKQVTTPLLTAKFSDTLAKESMVAWSLKKGKGGKPVIGGSMGFSNTPETEALRTNNLSKETPDGKPVITNGVDPNEGQNGGDGSGNSGNGEGENNNPDEALDDNEEYVETEDGLVPASKVDLDGDGLAEKILNGIAIGSGLVSLAKIALSAMGDDTTPEIESVVQNTAKALDREEDDEDDPTQTPVFVRHVSFDKPTLFSQSTVEKAPNPALYHNNIHTIVDQTGKGKLHISDGEKWVPIGTGNGGGTGEPGTGGGEYDEDIKNINEKINKEIVDRTNAIINEADKRVQAIEAEAEARRLALIAEAEERLRIAQAIAAETVARSEAIANEARDRAAAVSDLGSQITEEKTQRETAVETLTKKIDTISAGNSEEFIALLAEERTARITADSAIATDLEFMTSTSDISLAALKVLSTTQTIADSSLGEQIFNLTADFKDSTANIEERLTVLAKEDEALAVSITSLNTKVNEDISSAISTEIVSRSTADVALGERIDRTIVMVGDNTTAIKDETKARVTAEEAIGTRLNAIDVKVGNNTSSITSESQARVNADNAIGTRIDAVITRVGNSESAITTEVQSRTSADTALGKRIDAVQVTVGENAAAILAETQARADKDTALASQITNLTTTVGDNTTSITSFASSINGIRANYGVKVDNNGYISGYGLLSEPVNGTPVSTFTILADKFSLVKPGSAAIVPFSVDSTGANPIINLNGTVRVNGYNIPTDAIDGGHIAYSSISAGHIRANAITASKISATAIDGMTITGSVIQTASSGSRVIMNESDSNTIRFYNSSGRNLAQMGGGTGNVTAMAGSSVPGIFVGKTDTSGTFGLISNAGISTSQGTAAYGFIATGKIRIDSMDAGDVIPQFNAGYDLGSGSKVWKDVFVSNAPTVTSDVRAKEDIKESDLGLDFINTLKPVSYRLKVSGHTKVEGEELVGPHYVHDEKLKAEDEYISVSGKRRHYGLIAQEVKEALGDNDAAFWILTDRDDPDSKQALRYEEFISPMIKSIQELSVIVKDQQAEIALMRKELNELKGKM